MKISKSERLSLRLDEITKRKIEQVAAITQSSLNSFILTTVLAKADEIIRQHETMILSERDKDIFFNALLNPPTANNVLKNALANHEKLVESDV
jgi:uncharacterized protein (DUF1778 family)